MRTKQLSMAAVLAILGTSAALAVTPGADSPTAEGAKGIEQHDQSAQPSQSTTQEKRDSSATSGASTAPAKSDKAFTHGESKRCESMTGADKDQCDKEEGTKTEGAAAQEASKPQDSSKQ